MYQTKQKLITYYNITKREVTVTMAKATTKSTKPIRKSPPALTPEAREQQLIAMAYDAAEEAFLNGTASSQVITHFLKLGTTKAELEKEKLKKENTVLEAKAKAYQSGEEIKQLYEDAIKMLRVYGGQGDAEDYEYED